MEVLVLGAGGLLGSNVVRAATSDVLGTYHTSRPDLDIPLTRCDIRQTEQFRELLDEYAPSLVVNCAAMTDVDACEEHPERTRAVNAKAPGELATVAAERGVTFVHVSTDYVFDGTRRTPYPEDAMKDPLQEYGESKLLGESRVRQAASDTLVVRLSFLWGVHRGRDELAGFPAWVRDRLGSHEETSLFVDQQVTPTRAGAAAETLLDLATANESGTYHVASRSCVTPYTFGDSIRKRLGVDASLLDKARRSDTERVAQRPEYTCLDVTRVEETLGRPQPTLESGLDAVEDSGYL